MHNRVQASINLDAIRQNLKNLKENVHDDCQVMAVIKADAYGHGAVPVGREIEKEPYIFGFAVATIEEALELKDNDIKKPVLILGYTFPDACKKIVENDIRPSVFKLESAKLFSEEALRQKKVIKIHIAIDTGMSRIGYQVTDESIKEIEEISKLPNIEIEGLFTHFAKADEKDKTMAYEQLRLFRRIEEGLEEKDIKIPIIHCSNSAGIIDIKEANMNMVRAGISLYGLWPSDEVIKENVKLQSAMELKSHIVHIKTIPEGRGVSYGSTYVSTGIEKIATIPVGYGDGYPRSLSNKGYVLIHGKKAPIRGRVCMDQFMVDVSHIENVNDGDEGILIGKQEDSIITVEELADISGRFNYEFVCDLGKRIPRVFFENSLEISCQFKI